jgi:hypothetical protein
MMNSLPDEFEECSPWAMEGKHMGDMFIKRKDKALP